MSNQLIIEHPFEPILPSHARVMMMGSMPPTPDKWRMAFHYPNFQNDMWRIFGLALFDDVEYFKVPGEARFDPERIQACLWDKGIALCPTVKKAIREQGNASDKYLTIVEHVDLAAVLTQVPACEWLMTTGGKATEILIDIRQQTTEEKLKLPTTNQHIDYPYAGRSLKLYRLPSSSRAYPLSLANKAAAYQQFFTLAGLMD